MHLPPLINNLRALAMERAALDHSAAALGKRLYTAYRAAYRKEPTITLIDFLRRLDPSIPAARDRYRKHLTYRGVEYARRIHADRLTRADIVFDRRLSDAIDHLIATSPDLRRRSTAKD